MADIHNLLSRLEGVQEKSSPKHVRAFISKCPAHDDRSPSLSIALTHDDRILIHCHAGCGADAVLGAVGLEMTVLFPNTNYRQPPGYTKPLYTHKDYEEAFQAGEVAHNYIKTGRKPKPSDLPFIEKSLNVLLYFRQQIKGDAL